MIESGQPAPAFTLPDADMAPFDLRTLLGIRPFVVYFFIKDGTPGCTLEATEFSDLDDEFARLNCAVIGISGDDCLRHAEFRDQHGLSVHLLSDPDREVCHLYGVWQPKIADGVQRMCVIRSTFVVDSAGVVRHALRGVTPRGHAAEVLQLVRQLDSPGSTHADHQGYGRHTQLPGHRSGR